MEPLLDRGGFRPLRLTGAPARTRCRCPTARPVEHRPTGPQGDRVPGVGAMGADDGRVDDQAEAAPFGRRPQQSDQRARRRIAHGRVAGRDHQIVTGPAHHHRDGVRVSSSPTESRYGSVGNSSTFRRNSSRPTATLTTRVPRAAPTVWPATPRRRPGAGRRWRRRALRGRCRHGRHGGRSRRRGA